MKTDLTQQAGRLGLSLMGTLFHRQQGAFKTTRRRCPGQGFNRLQGSGKQMREGLMSRRLVGKYLPKPPCIRESHLPMDELPNEVSKLTGVHVRPGALSMMQPL
ncbi:MAG: hypothetical protein ACOZB0_06325 [Pseudomonadota bacterium]